jgi:hypothetical protein
MRAAFLATNSSDANASTTTSLHSLFFTAQPTRSGLITISLWCHKIQTTPRHHARKEELLSRITIEPSVILGLLLFQWCALSRAEAAV